MNHFKKYIFQALLLTLAFTNFSRAQEEWVWEEGPELRMPRMGHATVVFNDRIFVFGGMTFHRQHELTSSVEIYDPEQGIWIEGVQLPIPLYQATAVRHGNLIYLLGGTSRGGDPNIEIIVFDPAAHREPYHHVGRLPGPRWAMSSMSIGPRILLMGGVSGRHEYRRDGFWWNPDSSSWEQAPQLIQPSAGFGLASNGMIWAIGGISFGPLNRVEVLRNRAWESLPRRSLMPEPRGELGVVFMYDTLLIAAGGFGSEGAAEDVWAFSTNSMLWRDLPPLQQARAEYSLVKYHDQVWAIGGGTSTPNQVGVIHSSVEVLSYSNSVEDGIEANLPSKFETSIWPNPSNGVVNILLPAMAREILIFDISGRSISFVNQQSNNIPYRKEVSSLPAGSYRVVYFDAGGIARPAGGFTVLK